MGPFGSGKSSGCVIEIVKRAMAQAPGQDGGRKTRWVVVRNTYPQLRDTTIKTFHHWLPPAMFGTWRSSDHDYIIDAFAGCQIEVLFRALDRPEHVSNLLSLEVTGAWVNEAREIPWSIIQALQGRVGRYPSALDGGPTWFGIFADTNPPDADSWWYKLFEERRPENAAIFKQPSGRSPEAENLANLPKGYYDNLASGAADPEWVKVYVDGDYGFVIDGKPVYPSYNDQIHCQPCNPVPGRTIYRGWDFGLTPACVFTQVTPEGRWLVFDELCAEDLGIERFADELLLHSAQNYPDYQFEDIGDPAGMSRSETDERTCFQILNAKGVQIRAGLQDPTVRQESVRKPMGMLMPGGPGMVLDPRCKMLRKGFQGGYQFRRLQTASERYTDKPDKNAYSHPHDALQYVATHLFSHLLTLPQGLDAEDDDEFVIETGRSEVSGY